MTIGIVSPAPQRSTLGNSVTADRYAKLMRSCGWRVTVLRAYDDEDVDCLIALHARKSGRSALRFRGRYPHRPLVLVLTGTDVYRDLRTSPLAMKALKAATAIVTLQSEASNELPSALRAIAVPIVQSATCPRASHRRRAGLDVCVIGHMRAEKDPLRTAYAVRGLPSAIRVRVTQAGRALDARYAAAARREMLRDRRYRWVGEVDAARARRLLAASDLMVLSSRMEGGANVLCEAIACGVPVLASRIPGNTGILGRAYPGLYSVGDTRALAQLMRRAAEDRSFVARLRSGVLALRPLVRPARERRLWRTLIERLARAALTATPDRPGARG